jgi:hypothetical protein
MVSPKKADNHFYETILALTDPGNRIDWNVIGAFNRSRFVPI